MLFNRSVPCIYYREMRENREQKRSVPVASKRFGEESKESFPSPPGREPGAVKEEVALSKMECPLYFYREIRENCESL